MATGGTVVPVIGIPVKHLHKLLGEEIALEKLTETVEQLGCDLEDVNKTNVYQCPGCGSFSERLEHEDAPQRCLACGNEEEKAFPLISSDEVIRLDLLPARPDLFDAAGLARAIKGYMRIETGLVKYDVAPAKLVVEVDSTLKEKNSYRPYIVCAVVEVPPIETDVLRSLMKLQENLHWGIGRDRKLSSIGVYDLSTIKGPIRYRAVGPEELTFCPLGNPDEEMTPREILEKHSKGKAYAHLLQEFAKYPLLEDSQGQVLSMPPIINSHETRVKEGSSQLFIDVTGTTKSDVEKSLNTLLASLMEMQGKVSAVEIVCEGTSKTTPRLDSGSININLETARRWLGLDISLDDFEKDLARMRLGVAGEFPNYTISYPAYRTDIKHEVDIFEDLAIAYGYQNMNLDLVPTMTVGQARPEEEMAQRARQIMLGLGFVETMSLMLTTQADHFSKLCLKPEKNHALIENPKSAEHNIVRMHLMSGLMGSLLKNRRKALPQKYFEVGNVVLVDKKAGNHTHTREEKRLAFTIVDSETGYAEIRSILDAVFYELGWEGQYQAYDHPSFIPGRCARVTLPSGFSACLGEVHPEVLNNFGLANPVALAELTVAEVIGNHYKGESRET